MHNRIRIHSVIVVIISLLFTCSTLYAASVKDRMAARIPAINALKDSGVVGENKDGYLEFRTGNQADKATVSAENADRAKVYDAIAKNEGASPTLVGQRRAKMIASIGKNGHWFQAADGKWYQK
ncbi:YdbL family protein [Desulfosediminicola flagellatus]|uniref:YdbL family protein n=1 Tax=Desulfosediminicola flagellatus TaxID=2569541 RepID=UPI0010AD282B|nr:YdbL family protein [Desulfosediminicola flagellatus]